MQIALTPELVLKGGELLVLAFLTIVGLKIKEAVAEVRAEQAAVKGELIEKQNEMREDFQNKHAENKQEIAVHSASDTQQFGSIKEALVRIEKKVDYRNGKHTD